MQEDRVFEPKDFEHLNLATQDLATVTEKANRFLYLGANRQEVLDSITAMTPAELTARLKEFESNLIEKNPPININRINNNPQAKQLKYYFGEIVTVVKDAKLFQTVTRSFDFPDGIKGTQVQNREIDYLLWKREHNIISDSTLNQELERLMQFLVDSTQTYLKESEVKFISLLDLTRSNALSVSQSPYPENYQGDIQKDLAEPVKASTETQEVIDLDVLRMPEKRDAALSDILAKINSNENRIVKLAKTNDNLEHHLRIGVLSTYQEPVMKSVNRGVTRTPWPRGKADAEFQASHPELFGADKLIKEGNEPTKDLSSAELSAIRSKSQAQITRDTTPITRADIDAAKVKIQELLILKLINKSQQLFEQYGDSKKSIIINQLKALLLGTAFQKLRPSPEVIDRQIDDMLDRVEINLQHKFERNKKKFVELQQQIIPNSFNRVTNLSNRKAAQAIKTLDIRDLNYHELETALLTAQRLVSKTESNVKGQKNSREEKSHVKFQSGEVANPLLFKSAEVIKQISTQILSMDPNTNSTKNRLLSKQFFNHCEFIMNSKYSFESMQNLRSIIVELIKATPKESDKRILAIIFVEPFNTTVQRSDKQEMKANLIQPSDLSENKNIDEQRKAQLLQRFHRGPDAQAGRARKNSLGGDFSDDESHSQSDTPISPKSSDMK